MNFELIVIGGGIFGLSVARAAGRRGRQTLLIERMDIPNPVAASYGPSRKIRSTYLDPHYARLAREAMAAWRQLEIEVGRELYVPAGNLSITFLPEQPLLDQLEKVLREIDSPYQGLDEQQMRASFPRFRGAQRGLLEHEAGFLRATACVEALQGLAQAAGVSFLTGQEVEALEPAGGGLAVRAGGTTHTAEQVVLAGGGWSGRLIPDLDQALWRCQQGIMYVGDVPDDFRRPAFVPFSSPDDGYYGFPAEDGVGLKIARHALGEPLADPDFDRATLPPAFREGAERFASERLGLDPARLPLRFDSCMYNLSRSNDFLLDFYPRWQGLFIATAGSGHGFKFGSIIGDLVLDRLEGIESGMWSRHFSYESFLTAAPAPRAL